LRVPDQSTAKGVARVLIEETEENRAESERGDIETNQPKRGVTRDKEGPKGVMSWRDVAEERVKKGSFSTEIKGLGGNIAPLRRKERKTYELSGAKSLLTPLGLQDGTRVERTSTDVRGRKTIIKKQKKRKTNN